MVFMAHSTNAPTSTLSGGVFYAILTYRPPVSGASVAELIQKVRSGETTTMAVPCRIGAGVDPARIERVVPEALRAVTLKALAREKTKRYQSVSAQPIV